MKNWKTTLFGCLTAVATYLGTVDWNNPVDWKTLIAPILIAVWSFFQKDMNVTGGTTTQPTVVNVPSVPTK